jgi:hypothetical protein
MVNFRPQPLYPWGKNFWYSLNRRLGGPQSRSENFGKEKNPLYVIISIVISSDIVLFILVEAPLKMKAA